MRFETIDLEQQGAVATLRFNRPAHYNALSLQMSQELLQAALHLRANATVRALVITGTGKAFHAGGDIKAFLEEGDGVADYVRRALTNFHAFLIELHRAPWPVITAVNGVAAGAGFSLALAGDLCMASEEAGFTVAYSRIGASPDGGMSHFLTRAIGPRRAYALYLSNRVLTAREALDWGIVHEVVPAAELSERAAQLAASLADGPTLAYSRAKELIHQALDHSLETQLTREAERIVASSRSEYFREGIQAFVEKRPAHFRGR